MPRPWRAERANLGTLCPISVSAFKSEPHKVNMLISHSWMSIKRRAPALPMALTAISSVAFTSVGTQIVSEQKRDDERRGKRGEVESGKNENAIKADLAPGQSQRQTQSQRTATAAPKPAVHPLRLAAGLCVWPGSDFPSLWCPRLAIGLHATNANRHCQHKQLPLHLPNKPLQTTGPMPHAPCPMPSVECRTNRHLKLIEIPSVCIGKRYHRRQSVYATNAHSPSATGLNAVAMRTMICICMCVCEWVYAYYFKLKYYWSDCCFNDTQLCIIAAALQHSKKIK